MSSNRSNPFLSSNSNNQGLRYKEETTSLESEASPTSLPMTLTRNKETNRRKNNSNPNSENRCRRMNEGNMKRNSRRNKKKRENIKRFSRNKKSSTKCTIEH
jgi:hypothetical protein